MTKWTYLVVYICDVHHEVNVVAKIICHNPPQNVLGDIVPATACNVDWAIDQKQLTWHGQCEKHRKQSDRNCTI
jgi:hypothetical protein